MKENLSKTILSLLAVLTMSIHLVSCPSGKTNDNKATPIATLASTTILQDATDIVVNFTQAVAKGTGDIVLTPPVAEGEMAMPINIPLTAVTIGGTGDDENKVVTVTIPPSSRPLKIGSYTLSWVAGVFQTVAVAPATATDIAALILTFSVVEQDTVATLASTTIPQGATDIVVNFTQAVAKGTGDIVLTPPVAEGEMAMPVNIPLSAVTIGGTGDDENKVVTVTIPPSSRPLKIGSYTLSWVAGVFQTVAVAPATATDIVALILTFSVVEQDTVATLASTTILQSTTDIVVNFTQAVAKGTGNIVLTPPVAEGEMAMPVNIPLTAVTIGGTGDDENKVVTVTIPTSSRPLKIGSYTLSWVAGVFQTVAVAPATATDIAALRLTFSVEEQDTTPPTLISSNADSTSILPSDNIVLTMSEAVTSTTPKTVDIELRDTPQTSVDIGTEQLSIIGNIITIDPEDDLDVATTWSLIIPAGYFEDAAGNRSGRITLNFVVAREITPPTLISSVPPQNGEISVGDNIVLTMSEAVQINNRESSEFHRFMITSSIGLAFEGTTEVNIDDLVTAQITVSGATVTINPPENLTVGTLWTLTIPRGYILDGAGNPAEMILLTFDVVN